MRNGPEGSYYREKKKRKKYPRCWQKRVASFRCIKTCRPNMSDRSLYKRERKKKKKRHSFRKKKKILKNGCTVRMNLSKASMINCYCSFCVFFFFFFLSSFYFVKNACPSTLFSEGTRTDRPVAFNPIHGKRKEEGKRRKGGIESSFDFHPFLFSLEREHFFFFFFLPAWKLYSYSKERRGGEKRRKEKNATRRSESNGPSILIIRD